ncbi:hypothetical protein [Mycolicibacterium litorale]|uniref:Uncharacterized protein n=1 Tax=Mycolicibacterium litorale TaxID=758802 RepID=A0AAD1IHW7_9MYCO|nr:hypothetical protein [Mycolicibacterium litorale]MCV7418810.1 hypothetical protein [Mycolicibacterium litorale]TDY00408.1 hypothetical protein BCL50_5265 [Mycolicibacterium litorale]BBY15759.1 hypothetical protein MLIT_13510 [Mycolicibacterium litorale]
MRLRRRIFQPQVRTTAEAGRPIAVTLAGLTFDLAVEEARRFANQLTAAVNDIEGEAP